MYSLLSILSDRIAIYCIATAVRIQTHYESKKKTEEKNENWQEAHKAKTLCRQRQQKNLNLNNRKLSKTNLTADKTMDRIYMWFANDFGCYREYFDCIRHWRVRAEDWRVHSSIRSIAYWAVRFCLLTIKAISRLILNRLECSANQFDSLESAQYVWIQLE